MYNPPAGKWHTPARAAQERDYSGLRFERGITPSDIDAVIDFNNRLWILIEMKVAGVPLPAGQRLMLARLCESLSRITPTFLLIAEHNTPASRPIDAGALWVMEMYDGSHWRQATRPATVRQIIDLLHARYA